MGKVISLQNVQDKDLVYKEEVRQICKKLKDFDVIFMTSAINIAAYGEWHDWSEEQGEGAYFEFDTEMLANCNDSKVQAILSLMDEVSRTINKLKQ